VDPPSAEETKAARGLEKTYAFTGLGAFL